MEDGGLITGIFLLAFTVILFIIARITPKLELNRALKASHEAFIAQNGIIYEGAVYPFQSFMMRMDKVSLQKAQAKNHAVLVFSFTQFTGLYIIQPFAIVVPVPADEMDTASGILRALGGEVPERHG